MAEHSTVNRRVTGSSPVGGADIARTPERSSGVLAIYVPLARTSNPSGLRPRRGKDFWFLARSENLRLASSSPVGTFPLSREPVTTPPYVSAGALPSGSVWFESSRNILSKPRTSNPSGLRPRRGKDFWFLARSENLRLASSSPVGTFPLSREPVTTPPYVSAGALPSGSVWFESSRNILSKPRTSNPSGLRPRRGKDFWFLARSENLRLAGSSPVDERERRTIFACYNRRAQRVPAAGEHPPPALLAQVAGSLFLSSRLNLTPQKVENTPRDGRNLRSNGHEHLGRGAKI